MPEALNLPEKVTDEPRLELVSLNPYKFISTGVLSSDSDGNLYNSKLFPIGTVVELTEGKFPLVDYKDRYSKSNKTHVIGGKTVRIISFSDHCSEPNKNCFIIVNEHTTGGRRSRRSRRRRSRRSRSRRSRSRNKRY
jgi:hypothetical protein